MNVCGAAAAFSATLMSDFKIAVKFIPKRKITRYCTCKNDLKSYSSFAKTLLIKLYIKEEINLSDVGLDHAEINF